jgi:hypothetical protein
MLKDGIPVAVEVQGHWHGFWPAVHLNSVGFACQWQTWEQAEIPLDPQFEEFSPGVTLNHLNEFIFWELSRRCLSYMIVDALILYH